MGILMFIFCITAVLVTGRVILGTVGIIFSYKRLEEENKELKKKVGNEND